MGAIFWLVACLSIFQACSCVDYSSDPSVQLFQEYLQINTTTGNDLTDAVDFWKRLADQEDLPIYIYEYTEGYPVVVIKWAGTNSSLQSVMLNSHMDVVPAEADGWTYPPFEAHIDDNGDIYARGSQDMKSVSIQYFEAIRRLKAKNVMLTRDVYMTLMPDEEVGGENGIIPFIESTEFEAMNVGVEMDEGAAFPLPMIATFYQDKVVWQIQVDCYGIGGHGSTFLDTNSTATGKCTNVINRLQKFRDEQFEVYEEVTIMNAGHYTSSNLNIMEAGTANNIIPSHVKLIYDIRLGTSLNEEEFEAQLSEWIDEAGDNITLTYVMQNQQSPATIISDSNPYWVALSSAAEEVDITLATVVPSGSTDARYVRNIGIPAFGFSPMPNTPMLLHSVDEYLNADTFLQGIDIYEEIITSLANIPGDQTLTDRFSYVAKTT